MEGNYKLLVVSFLTALIVGAGFWYEFRMHFSPSQSENIITNIIDPEAHLHPRLRGLSDWQRPSGPWRVALQVGHWNAAQAPEEQKGLRQSTGGSFGNTTEWEVALAIAQETEALLESNGVEVEILPTTIPPNYWADAFVSIHADGNESSSASGYKVAASRHDYTGKAEQLAALLNEEYGAITLLTQDINITRTMRGYYAFNWRRYEHSLHPMTPAVIIETGFLTNSVDRRIIVAAPTQAAKGIANGILKFLNG